MEDVADVYKVSLSSNTSACSTCNLHIDTAGADGISFNSELDTLHHVGYPHVDLLRDTNKARRDGHIKNNKVTNNFVRTYFGANSWMDLWKYHIMLPKIEGLLTANLELAASTLEQIIWKRKRQSDECRRNGHGICHQHMHMIYQAEICLQAVLNEICKRENIWDETHTVRILSTVNTERLNKMIHYMKVFIAHEGRKLLKSNRDRARASRAEILEERKEILKRFTGDGHMCLSFCLYAYVQTQTHTHTNTHTRTMGICVHAFVYMHYIHTQTHTSSIDLYNNDVGQESAINL